MKYDSWKEISFQFNEKLETAIQQQHLAAQLIALVGRYLVPQKPDLSNINMQYISSEELLLGRQFANGMQLGLNLSELEIYLLNNQKTILGKIQLNDKTFEKAYEELRLVLIDAGADISNLKNEQPYVLPMSSLLENKFSGFDKANLKAATVLRHNAEILVTDLAGEFKDAVPVRIWPHHFDTGTFFATNRNQSREISQTIGLGWALPDNLVNETYFYLSFWSEKEIENTNNLPPMSVGKWLTPDWNGAVLQHSDIIKVKSAQKQYQLVKQFFNEGVSTLTHLLKNNSL